MTIRLLCPYGKYPANAIVTLDSATEAGLVLAKLASLDTTGGVPWVPPAVPNQLRPANLVVDASGAVLGLAGPNNTVLPIGGGGKWSSSSALIDGNPVVVALGGGATSVYRTSVNPASGDSVLVETGTSSAGPWTPWPRGATGTPDDATWYPGTPAVTHMRFTRTAGSGTTSRFYVDEISN